MLLLNSITDGEDDQTDVATVNMEAQKMSRSFTIDIINDNITECDKTFKLMLTIPAPPCEVVVGNVNATEVTIKDNSKTDISNHKCFVIY